MNIGLISKSGLGDLIQVMQFMPSIYKNIMGINEWTFFVKISNRNEILEKYIAGIFHDSINVNIYYYDPRDENNIVQKANEICDWVFAPMSDNQALCPLWVFPSSFCDVKKVCKTSMNLRKLENKDKYSNCTIFCHLYSGSRGEERNLPFEAKNQIGKALINNFGVYNVALFSWDDPDVSKYSFKVIENPDVLEIIQSENNQFYIGVDSWIHSLIAGTNDWICWTEKEWKMNTQRVSSKVFINPGYRTIFSSCETDKIIDTICSLKQR